MSDTVVLDASALLCLIHLAALAVTTDRVWGRPAPDLAVAVEVIR